MRKTVRRGFSLFLAVLLLMTAAPAEAFAAQTPAWRVENDTLIVSGDMPNYSTYTDSAIPWLEARYHVTRLVVEKGVTQLGDFAFCWMGDLKEVSLPNTLRRIGVQSMASQTSLMWLELPESVEEIDHDAFQISARGMVLTVLNPSCRFGERAFGYTWDDEQRMVVLQDHVILRGYEGSTAEAYAAANGIRFLPIDENEPAGWDPDWQVDLEPEREGPRKDAQGRIHLETLEDFLTIPEDLGGSYILDGDIEVGGAWTMPYEPFTGTLDGDGHALVGLTLSGEAELGLFQYLEGVVCNLEFRNARIQTDARYPRVGVIAARSRGEIVNCSVSGSIEVTGAEEADVGGMAGSGMDASNQPGTGGRFINCESDLKITVEANYRCCAGGFSSTGAELLQDSRCGGSITVNQSVASGGRFNVYGIMGADPEAAVNCTCEANLTVALASGAGYAFGLFNASESRNTGNVRVTSENGQATAQGGENVIRCANEGEIFASARSTGLDAVAIGLNQAVDSENHGTVEARSAGKADAFASGISGKSGEESGTLKNTAPVTASAERGNAAGRGVENAGEGQNDGSVTASSNTGGAGSYGISKSGFSENYGAVEAASENGAETVMACGLVNCTDSYNYSTVTAKQGGTANCFARGCSGGARCVNEGDVRAEGRIMVGASGLESSTDSSNTGSVYAKSAEADPDRKPTVYAYGYRSGTRCVSTGPVEAVGSAFRLDQKENEGGADYTAVDAGHSSSVTASVAGFYSVTATPGNPVPVYLYIQNGVYQGVVHEVPASVPQGAQYPHMKTFSADGNTTLPTGPRDPEPPKGDPNLSLTDLYFCPTRGSNEIITTIGVHCGSFSFNNGRGLKPNLENPLSTDYRKLALRIGLRNSGSGASGTSEISIVLPEGFSFSPDVLQRNGVVEAPEIEAGGTGCAWADVYPIYSESYKNGDAFPCRYQLPSGAEETRDVSICRASVAGSPTVAKVYYGRYVNDPELRLFKEYQWNAEAFGGSSLGYKEAAARLSALLSQAAELLQQGEEQMALEMLSALGLSLIQVRGDSTAMGSKVLLAKKIFAVKSGVYELTLTSMAGATDPDSWLGMFAFVSTDGYHAAFKSAADKAKEELNSYNGLCHQLLNPLGTEKYLITGHSRGGASAYLLARMLKLDAYPEEDVFCYTFGAPNACKPASAGGGSGGGGGSSWGGTESGSGGGGGGSWDPGEERIINLVNYSDVMGYIPGCYEKYGTTWVYDHELDTGASLYIAPVRAFSTDELLLGNANALQLQVTLAFLLPQIRQAMARHRMSCYLEDLWVLGTPTEGKNVITMAEADQRQDAFCKKYFDGPIKVGSTLQEIVKFVKDFAGKTAVNLTKATGHENALVQIADALSMTTGQMAGDYIKDKAFDIMLRPALDDLGRGLLRKGYTYLKCPVDVRVYDESGAQVAAIENDRVTQWGGDLTIVTEGSRKLIRYPLEKKYRFEVTGYDSGTMDAAYYETDENGNLVNIRLYEALPVAKGSGAATVQAAGAGSWTLTTPGGGAVEPGSSLTGEALAPVTVKDSSGPDVKVLGCGTYYPGEYTRLLSAYTGEEERSFRGWYDGSGTLLGTDPILSVPVERDLTVEARYGEPLPGIAGAVREGAQVRVALRGLGSGGVLYGAAYDGSGRMTGSALRELGPHDTEAVLPLPSSAASVRVFLVEKGTYRPLCASWQLR